MQAQALEDRRLVSVQRAEDIGRESSVAGTRLDEIERLRGIAFGQSRRHLSDLDGQQFAEERTDIDAGEEIAGAS